MHRVMNHSQSCIKFVYFICKIMYIYMPYPMIPCSVRRTHSPLMSFGASFVSFLVSELSEIVLVSTSSMFGTGTAS